MVNSVELGVMSCSSCGKKLAEIKLNDGTVSIKCNKCGTINIRTTIKSSKTTNSNY